MSKQVITLSQRAAERVKEIMAQAKEPIVGVRVGVESGGCAGMSYVMEYAKEANPNDEIIEDKGVKVLIDPKAIMYLLGTEMDYKKKNFHQPLSLKIPMKLSVVGAENPLRFNSILPLNLELYIICLYERY